MPEENSLDDIAWMRIQKYAGDETVSILFQINVQETKRTKHEKIALFLGFWNTVII